MYAVEINPCQTLHIHISKFIAKYENLSYLLIRLSYFIVFHAQSKQWDGKVVPG